MKQHLRRLLAAVGTLAMLTTPAAALSVEQAVDLLEEYYVDDLPQPAYEYIVESATVQNGMSSQSTAVVLKDAEGRTVKAFARGLHAALTPGAALTQVKLSVKKQGTVVFYFLESYELADGRRAA